MEIFKEIPNMPGYFASNQGRIRRGNDKIISLHETTKGYLKVQIMMNGVRHSLSVHRVIASVFLGDVTGMEVDHLDFDKKNNFVENLEIVTKKENMRRYHSNTRSEDAYKKISVAQSKRWAKTDRPPPKERIYPRKFEDGERPKTGGRKKGSGGVFVRLTIPKETAQQLPSNAKELRGFLLDAALEKINSENSQNQDQ